MKRMQTVEMSVFGTRPLSIPLTLSFIFYHYITFFLLASNISFSATGMINEVDS